MIPEVERYIGEHLDDALGELKRLCSQPSVSAQNLGLEACAQMVKGMLEEIGAKTRVIPTPGGPPVVLGHLQGASSRTILFYDHYDVQPPEPLDLWTSPPFQPEVRDERLFARGASDDKGNLAVRIAAVKAYIKAQGRLPCTVKFFVEGEEEVGSPHLPAFFKKHLSTLRTALKADGCIWEGGGVTWHGTPLIHLGLKGILYLELEAQGPNRDLHSSYGTVVPSPAWHLLWALSTIKGPRERVLIPGFYDDVRRPTRQELQTLKSDSNEEQDLKKRLGIKAFINGVKGFQYRKRLLMDPGCSICGFETGYNGPGAKTVLPSKAKAKIDFRLVPNQRPDDILDKLKSHLESKGFGDIQVRSLGSTYPARTTMGSPWVKLVSQAAEAVYKKTPKILPNIAGSGPMYPFTDTLGIPTVTAGVGYPDNRIHAPDENIRIQDFLQAILHTAEIIERTGKQGPPKDGTDKR